ncbi:MAG: replication restart helicase PriA [Thermomicrobiales bacterium]
MEPPLAPPASAEVGPTVAEVAVDGAYASGARPTLSYAVPPEWVDRITPGQLVWAPLRKQVVLGVVVTIHQEPVSFALKPLRALVEPEFRLSSNQMETVRWLARETASTLFAAVSPFFPPGVTHRAVEHLRLTIAEDQLPGDLTPAQRQLTALLAERGDVPLATARKELGRSLTSVVAKLEERGLLTRIVQVTDRVPLQRQARHVRLLREEDGEPRATRQRAVVDYLARRRRLAPAGGDLVPLADVLQATGTDHGVVSALARKGWIEEVDRPPVRPLRELSGAPAPSLTPDQARVWPQVERALRQRGSSPMLLHGVTGSGKTEVYLRAVAWCLRHERSAIVLVPEIALAAQVVRRFTARFPGQVAVMHSGLSDAERYANWRAIAAGNFRVVVGPRSALFAPVRDLGLIVLDEEHESAYKQESEPRYHARALAEHIAAQLRAVLILGSATPSVETFHRAESGAIRMLSLPNRVGPRRGGVLTHDGHSLDLPPVEIIDMRLELHRGNTSLFSERLQHVLDRTLLAGEQALLLLNRRGMATIVVCRTCGGVVRCPFCDIPLVFHQDRGRLLCHRCNHRQAPIQQCPDCGGPLNYFGAGTQRVEAEVRRLFPEARVARWDQDSVRRQGGHEALLRRIERREVDVVVGTQMIAKGLDLPLVTAIGVIHADTLLHLPDFRSGERTFQLLTQVAGRAGRQAPGGEVVVQSYSPEHYAIQAAARHDYHEFFAEEIDFRRVHRYPPYTRLVRYLFRHADEEECLVESDEMARQLARHARRAAVSVDLLGPTPAFASRIRGKHQWQIILRAEPAGLEALLDDLPARPGWWVDVDPQSLL